jgi:UDP-N-acetylmuramate dehydrogenase
MADGRVPLHARVVPAVDDSVLDAVAESLGDLAQRDVPLGDRTTYRVGGPAGVLVAPRDTEGFRRLAVALGSTTAEVPVLVIGRGSNLLVADAGFGGVVVVLDDGWDDLDIQGTRVRAGGAASLPVVARRTAAAGLTGFEWAVGVPGSMGGAVRMNAGGHGSDMAASVTGVRLFDLRSGEDVRVPADRLSFGYRQSSVAATQVVLEVDLQLASGDRESAEATLAEIVRWRRANQPGGANAGSVFTNPPGDSAGRLIDASGVKGLRLGSAEVSTKHANFIQADADGSADDVRALMTEVALRVTEATGVQLEPETRIVGFPGTSGGPAVARAGGAPA